MEHAANLPLGFFDQQVLAAYRAEPDKWLVETDNLDGHLETTTAYYERLKERQEEDQYASIRFGYRAQTSGDLAVVAWLPDLVDKSSGHLRRWRGFHLQDPIWAEHDPRFDLWIRRYIDGDWSFDNGVRSQLAALVDTIRALTREVLGVPMFKFEIPTTLAFPAAENSHRYQDSHRELYGYVIDGLDKAAIAALSARLATGISIASEKTVNALKKILPESDALEMFWAACALVGEQRRLAAHSVRQPPVRFEAFEAFTRDLELCVAGTLQLLGVLEKHCGADRESALRRQEAMAYLPKVARPAEPHYSICQATAMIGKTVETVEFGFRGDIPGVHDSELLICQFNDGSIVAIDTGSNAQNFAVANRRVSPEEFHVDLNLHWVPPLKKVSTGSA